ncbi:MAG TPA: hypothetical protein VFS16_08840, partial [Acidimicrobiia bacterium]|nr:hypothetical protein [Acidimicrobiia bacterium]
MSRRLVPTVIAIAALALVGFPGTADAGSAEACFGSESNVVGTDGDDVISVFADEAGVFGRINGERFSFDHHRAVIRSGSGDDKITFDGDPGSAFVCSGRGNDVIAGRKLEKVSAGPGKDRVSLNLVCNVLPVVYDAEKVEITGFDSVEEG